MKQLFTPYLTLLQKVLQSGVNTSNTKALYNVNVKFDLTPLNHSDHNSYRLALPEKRGTLSSSMKYAIAEAAWYRKATQEIDLIVPFGKIWANMVDDENKVQSNYGYQLTHNQDIHKKIRELVETGFTRLSILSNDNQSCENDLVCNNFIELMLTNHISHYALDGRVIARSIDVIYGLPYDFFALQGLMAYVGTILKSKYHKITNLRTATFNIINCHWYTNQLPSGDELSSILSESACNALYIEDFSSTPFHPDFDINQIQSVEDVKAFRNGVTYSQGELTTFSSFAQRAEHPFFIRQYGSLEDAEMSLKDFFEDNDRVDAIIQKLKVNPFDRKAIIKDDEKVAYLVCVNPEKGYFNQLLYYCS